MDFDDLLRLATRDLEADPVYATARRWRFRYLYVDEFQDVNPLQHRLLTAWLGSESTLCVVGDPNQAIYSWNGADARYLVDFDRFFPGGSTVTLHDNYRSTPRSSPRRTRCCRPVARG
ncbi:MAG: UvrD-helicase domain-containing protein [Microthrixaceae bacterium]|nr:UvrD-helicase domain-containing protein [Microthrixaceae bacterium]